MKLRIIFTALVLVFALQTDAKKGDPEKFSTKNIEVVLKDENGFSHFIVFSKIRNSEGSKSVYTADFWVNDQVSIVGYEVWSIMFRTDEENYAYRISRYDRGGSYDSAKVLYFEMPEEELKLIADAKNIKVRMIMKGEKLGAFPFKDYSAVKENELRRSMKEILKY